MSLTLTTTRPFNPSTCSPWKDMRRVALNADGTVYKYHNPIITGDSTNAMFDDDTSMTWNAYATAGYNCMVEIPKFYYKKVGFNESTTDFTNGHAWYISDTPTDGFELHPAFMRCRDKLCTDQTGTAIEVNYRYAPAFFGWRDVSGKLRSLPLKTPVLNITIGDSRTAATLNGNGWGILDFNLFFAIQLLYSVEYGNYNSQTALGRGYVDGNSAGISTGGTLQYGNSSYGETTGKKQMSYRGIEDLWGNYYRWIDGFITDFSANMFIGNKGFNDVGTGYSIRGTQSNVGGYIGNIQANKECGFVISAIGGSDTTKLFDTGYLQGGLPFCGGRWTMGSSAGIFYFQCSLTATSQDNRTTCSLTF